MASLADLLRAAGSGLYGSAGGFIPDTGVNLANLVRAAYGYGGSKLGLLAPQDMPDMIDPANVPGTTANVSGLLGVGNSIPEQAAQFVGGLLGPGGTKNAAPNLGMTNGGRSLEDILKTWENSGVTIDAGLSRSQPELVTLSKIEVPKNQRNQGIGTAAMQDVVQYADDAGKTVALSPSTDFGASSVSRLRDFYKRFGFVENKGKHKDFTISESMYRLPQKSGPIE